MKIYFHLNLDGFSNSYVIVNEETKSALIIDPGLITKDVIDQIEGSGYNLEAILITHNHRSHIRGIKTLLKIYQVPVIAADAELAGDSTSAISSDGDLWIGGLNIQYYSIPGHSTDSIVYKIGAVMFVGDTMESGRIGQTNSSYSEKILKDGIFSKILSQTDETILMPGHGPPTTVGVEKSFY